ncbi:hypothetical protein L210DRAFT_3564531 [Boletus edulis BED1]|uniref:Secreted protein n=1 Tax=Boletus edulis BED1 TaxID=1328754 RepID=A0AAD4G8F0_BOLED|nr:hypothetical protein L210DRAFT_3564531 [Boletus edulis BED1]
MGGMMWRCNHCRCLVMVLQYGSCCRAQALSTSLRMYSTCVRILHAIIASSLLRHDRDRSRTRSVTCPLRTGTRYPLNSANNPAMFATTRLGPALSIHRGRSR